MSARKVPALGSTPWLRPPEAAAYLRIGESLMAKLIGERTVPSYTPSKGVTLLKTTDLDNYVETHRREVV